MVRMLKREPGDCVRHEECPACKALGGDSKGDNLAVYRQKDGTHDAYCWKCTTHYSATEYEEMTPVMSKRCQSCDT